MENDKLPAWVYIVLILLGIGSIINGIANITQNHRITELEKSHTHIIVAETKHNGEETEMKIEIDPVRVELTDLCDKLKSMKSDVL